MDAIGPQVRPIARQEYRAARLAFLKDNVALGSTHGLEIGALDLPTVVPEAGRCDIADVRPTEELARLFDVPIEAIAPVRWVLERNRPIAPQIPRRYDYVILCHVLEHVPEPIRFLNDVGALLGPGGVMVLAVPDKRQTYDAGRPSTTIDHLLARHYHDAPAPPLAQIMEFARAWNDDLRRIAEQSPHKFFAWATTQYESGHADVHCNVWEDHELFAQLEILARGGFLPNLTIRARHPNQGGFNEFYIALERTS